ncbi:hydrogenase maturation protease [Actinacidiphila yanglinensis]|uniref:Hydrogenase maturation protease n=1 Tax=Actinacidiphila yanglinensis TaxID=310779 RepID=A0A1H6D6U0_9ACTN|nr:hydrogenase maturation protease [Actinacidiphila yanglinensis]SEG80455.1 hydrogenase maturation protease [Actinacidiphila yanglinensis]
MNAAAAPRTLVAGVGNVFLGDDGFGVETVRRLAAEAPLPPHVEAVDIGVRGVHLAYQLLDGYDTFVLVDATARGGRPGTLYLIEADVPGMDGDRGGGAPVETGQALLDGHRMSPDSVLALLGTLCAGTGGIPPRRVLVVGCEPANVEEGIGLSRPVEAAVPEAVRLVRDLLDGSGDRPLPGHTPSGHASHDRPAAGPPVRDRVHDQGANQERNTSPC